MLGAAVDLAVHVDALAALAAWLRVRGENLPCDPAVGALLDAIAEEVLGDAARSRDTADVDPVAAGAAVGLTRAFLRQAVELVENPGRAGAWDQVDVPLLQSIGRLSMGIAGAVRAAEATVPGLRDVLARPGATILDIGTGTGWLAIALAHAYPTARVVGLDIFEPALELARANVAEQGLQDRVELRRGDASVMDDVAAFDVVWLPLPFLPAQIFPAVVEVASRALRPGGVLLPGTFTGSGGRIEQLATDLRIVRSGGHPWQPAQIVGMLADAGFRDVGEVPRTWPAPVRLYAGTR